MTILQYLTTQGYSKKECQTFVLLGHLYYQGTKVFQLNLKISDPTQLVIKKDNRWVSRGAYKLLGALSAFALNPTQLVCLDIGASTGGFTEVLLAKGAAKVYALDVGTNQLAYKLRIDPRVVVMEQTNLKTITTAIFAETLQFVVIDVAFISLKQAFRVLAPVLVAQTSVVVLLKPQFEAPSQQVARGGFVDQRYHEAIIERIIAAAKADHFVFQKILPSPIRGNKAKNIEYLVWFKKGVS